MNFKIKEIKKEARVLLKDRWNTVVLGYFIPFLIGIVIMLPSYPLQNDINSGEDTILLGLFDVILSTFLYSLVSYAFLVGVYNFLLFPCRF